MAKYRNVTCQEFSNFVRELSGSFISSGLWQPSSKCEQGSTDEKLSRCIFNLSRNIILLLYMAKYFSARNRVRGSYTSTDRKPSRSGLVFLLFPFKLKATQLWLAKPFRSYATFKFGNVLRPRMVEIKAFIRSTFQT